MKNFFLLFSILLSHLVFSQTSSLSGKIILDDGDVAIGANIFIKDLNLGTSSDINGYYNLNGIKYGKYEISISYIGYNSISKSISFNDNTIQFDNKDNVLYIRNTINGLDYYNLDNNRFHIFEMMKNVCNEVLGVNENKVLINLYPDPLRYQITLLDVDLIDDNKDNIDYESNVPICFLKGTPVLTDQGIIDIDKVTNKNTINKQKVLVVTKTKNPDNFMILIKKNSLGFNVPNEDTYITRKHSILVNNKLVEAQQLINNNDILKVYLNCKIVYNILLHRKSLMSINNMMVETLHPKNAIAKKYFNKGLVNKSKNSFSYDKVKNIVK